MDSVILARDSDIRMIASSCLSCHKAKMDEIGSTRNHTKRDAPNGDWDRTALIVILFDLFYLLS